MKKLIIAVFISFMLTIAAQAYSGSVQTDLRNNLVRLHIIANSDSDYDQSVKLRVRDAVLKYESERLLDAENIANSLFDIEKTASAVLSECGAEYGARAEYGKYYFPKKEYKNMILPQGEYYGVRVVLGTGAGKNWWCVMYPPLCMINDTEAELSEQSKKLLAEKLGAEAYDVITEKNGEIKVKFRIVEAAQCIKEKFLKSASK